VSGLAAPVPASRRLVDALIGQGILSRPGAARVIETHISWVILTGEFAYKIKKPLNLGFLDFSTLDKRHQACREELRLNRRLTPELYLDVIAIHGRLDAPTLGPGGPVIEYAVKMREFPAGSMLTGPAAIPPSADQIDALAILIAKFHQSLPPAPPATAWGLPEQAWAPAQASLRQLTDLLPDPSQRALLLRAGEFLEGEHQRQSALMRSRRDAGFVRECHGDLHLGNLARIGNRIVPFDALEFDPALRWIDVLNEVAFLAMDLETRSTGHLGYRFLNGYLDVTGDHSGLPVLPFYLSYRALVRAKIAALAPGGASDARMQRIGCLLTYAANPRPTCRPLLIVMMGVSGSGKSFVARQLAAGLPAIHLRSDVERKRLRGLAALQRTNSALDQGIYAPDVSARTYRRLGALAASALDAGLPAIIDATNLSRERRAPLIEMARRTGRPAAVLACGGDEATIERRVQERNAQRRDPSEAGLEVVRQQRHQLQWPEPDEADIVINLDTTSQIALDTTLARLRSLCR
jgi:hypothetical protein